MPCIVDRMLKHCAVAMLMLAAFLRFAEAQALHVTDLQGHSVERLATKDVRAVVLIFAATDCPISNRYIPEITRLDSTLASRGVAFWWVFPNPGDTLSVVRKHNQDFSIAMPTIVDARQELVHMAHVAVTPEVAVFAIKDGTLREVYHGRIDDRYIAFGQERPQAARHELEDAVNAVLAGRPLSKPEGEPIGCSIIPVALKP